MSSLRRRWQMKPRVGAQIVLGHPLARGLVGCYLFNEGGGLGYEKIYGSPLSTTGSVPWTTGGTYGLARSFDGVLNNSLSASGAYLPSAPTTYSIVVISRVTGGSGTFRELVRIDGGAQQVYIGAHSNNNWMWSVHNLATEYGAAGAPPYVLNADTMVAGTYDGTSLNMYVNGVGFPIFTDSDPIPVASTPLSVTIGGLPGGAQEFTGLVYYALIYSRELSAAEAQQLYVDPYCFMNPPSPRRIWNIQSASTLTCSVFN